MQGTEYEIGYVSKIQIMRVQSIIITSLVCLLQ